MRLLTRAPLIRNAAPAYVSPVRSVSSVLNLGAPAMGNAEAQMKAYGSVGVLFAIVARISEAVAEADWCVCPIGEEDPIPEHPAAQLWENPNTEMTQDEFIEIAMQHFELAGETDWIVSRASKFSPFANNQRPLELWPVRPDWMTPVPSATNFLDGWVYQVPGGSKVPYVRQDVIQVKRPNPLDAYRGLAPIASAMIDVYGERAASDYNVNFFRNGAVPGGMIEFEERLQNEAYEEFVQRWNDQHQGSGNAHKVGIIEGGKWVDVHYAMRDMQFEELRKLNREFIRQAYGYPKSMLGDTEDVNKASAIAGEYVFVRWLVRPLLNRIQATLNSKLLPQFGADGKGVEFKFTTPVPADKELEIKDLDSQATRAKTLVDAGFDPADVLEWCGIPEMGYSKPAPKAAPGQPAAPDSSTGAGGPDATPDSGDIPMPGRPSRTSDTAARAVWDEAQTYWQTHKGASFETVSALLGVSERTLRRYRDVFAE